MWLRSWLFSQPLLHPCVNWWQKREKEQQLQTALWQIRGAIDAYKSAVDDGRIEKKEDESGYPPTLEDLVLGIPDIKSEGEEKKIIYFLRRLPRDPMHQQMDFAGIEADTTADTWGKRSYESSPESPQEGDDVFDVYSRSEEIGLNGTPYNQW